MSDTAYPGYPKGNIYQQHVADDKTIKWPEEYTIASPPEKAHNIFITNSIIKEKINQFKSGKYSEKYIKTYLDFVLMEGIIDNLSYLEHLKEISTK